jgi:hypothetical protein
MPSPQQVMEKIAEQEPQAQEPFSGGEYLMPGFSPGSETPEPGVPIPDTTIRDILGFDPGTATPEPDAPVPDKTTSILAGLGVLLVILVILTMYTVASMPAGTGQNSGIQGAETISGSSDYGDSQSMEIPTATITPVIISSTPATIPAGGSPGTVQTPDTPRSYVTIEAVPVTSRPILKDITEDLPAPSAQDYFTIYAMNHQEAVTTLPYVSFNLVNPPLVIDYTVTPLNITKEKDVVYKIVSTSYEEKHMINRPYEHDWFKIIVRDRDTGTIVAEDGYGRTYSQDSPRKLAIYKGGNYRFEFSGQYVNVSLTMKVQKEGNIL